MVLTIGHALRAQQRLAVTLDHATSLAYGCFFRRPARKITIPFKCGTPKSKPLESTSLQPTEEALSRSDALSGLLEVILRLVKDGVFIGHDGSIRTSCNSSSTIYAI